MERLTYYKLIFFVPVDAVEVVKEAIFKAGAGKLGEYTRCAWQCLGQGQFMPSEKANPSIGQHLLLSHVEEYKVEILCDEYHIKDAILALKDAHPYEEAAFEVVKLEDIMTLLSL